MSYSDILYTELPIGILTHLEGDIELTYYTKFLELWKQRFKNPLDDLEGFQIDEQRQLLEIGKRVQYFEEIQGQYMGLLKFTPGGWKTTGIALQQSPPKPMHQIDMTSALDHFINKGLEVHAAACNDFWIEVNSIDDLQLYEGWKKDQYQRLMS